MILAISPYFQPLRIFILNDDGSLRAAYRSAISNLRKEGFYDLDIKLIIEHFLMDDIKLEEIKTVAILGKPIPYFEEFLRGCLLKPGIKSARKFSKGVPFYFQKIFRIKRDLEVALRHSPSFYFISCLEAYIRAPSLLNCENDIFFWGIHAESVRSILIQGQRKEITLLRRFDDIIEKSLVAESAKQMEEMLEQSRRSIPFESGLIVSNPISDLSFSIEKNVCHFYDAPTLALAGMCDLLFAHLDKDHERADFFRGQLFSDTSAQEDKIPDLAVDRIFILDRIWSEHKAFKTI